MPISYSSKSALLSKMQTTMQKTRCYLKKVVLKVHCKIEIFSKTIKKMNV
ncbi:hypothetical protein CCA_00841 [Chlamydia caviae GPIC]|uniref:Uncharacterized protein n=1 Tax=Chlamydia caviae (strain ATCC VR-813 / DSM 19441 / 03DC25 / GPIC) TaxID=227941 RepID=Q821U4_CHLCV|nr:hypothetical protein CCA_00841 [Chlamydia caviae GPIC]